jgi:hypothetical protein
MDKAQEISPAKWEHTTDIRWALLPLLTALGGAYVYKDTSEPFFSTQLVTMLALILGGWVPLWMAMTDTNWAHPLTEWENWTELEALPTLPYLQANTAGSFLHRRLSQAQVWWRKVGRHTLTTPLLQVLLGLLTSLLLGYIIGRSALLLTLMYFTSTQLAVLWSGGHHEISSGWLAVTQAGLPWLLGASLEQSIQMHAVLSGIVLIVLIGLYTLTSPLALIGPIAAAIYLIWQEQTIAAGWLLLLALPGYLALGRRPSPLSYRKAALPWILCMVGLLAWVL